MEVSVLELRDIRKSFNVSVFKWFETDGLIS